MVDTDNRVAALLTLADGHEVCINQLPQEFHIASTTSRHGIYEIAAQIYEEK